MLQNRSPSSSLGKHVGVFASPGISHALPLFNLTLKLANAAPLVHFSYFSSARQYSSIIPNENNLPSNLKAYKLEDGVPKGYDLEIPIPKELEFFMNAMPKNLELGMDSAVKETAKKISCLITDSFLSSTISKLAMEIEAPWVAFWVAAPHLLSAWLHADDIKRLYLNSLDDQNQTLDAIPGLSLMRIGDLPKPLLLSSQETNCHQPIESMSNMGAILTQASAVVLNSCEELNPKLLKNDLQSRLRNLLYVGFLTAPEEFISKPTSLPPSGEPTDDPNGCISWLNEQEEASVVYISFGSMAPLSREEIVELAEALEASELPFLWSLRDVFKEHLPKGFIERARMRGKVVPWAPQKQVLSHPSIGVHVTHCGYNAVGESLFAGVPMICRPIWADNLINGRMIEDIWEIGVGIKGGKLTKSSVLESLETVFHQEKGRTIKEATKKLRNVVVKAVGPDGSATKDFNTIVQIVSQE